MDFFDIATAKIAFEAKKDIPQGNPLAKAKLESEIPESKGILNAPQTQLLFRSPEFLKKTKGTIEIKASDGKIEAAYENSSMEIKLDGEKAGSADFNSMELEASGNKWKLIPMEEKKFYGKEHTGYRLEKNKSIFIEIRAFPETDESEFDQCILFANANVAGISKQEKACLVAFAALAKSQFESLPWPGH